MLSQKNPSSIQYANNESIQGVFDGSKFADYSTAAGTTSADPFSTKTNKYAESSVVRIVCPQACCLKFSASGTEAVDGDYFLPANTPAYFGINTDRPYLRVIPLSSAKVYVTEIF